MLTPERMEEIETAIEHWNCEQSGDVTEPLNFSSVLGPCAHLETDILIKAAQEMRIPKEEIVQLYRQLTEQCDEESVFENDPDDYDKWLKSEESLFGSYGPIE